MKRRPEPAPTRPRPRRATSRALLMVLGAAAVAAAGCGADGSAPAPSSTGPTTLPAPATSDPAMAARQAALAAYEAMWAAYDGAGRAPAADPDDPRLAAHASGRALEVLTDGLASLRGQGLVIEGQVALHPEVVALSPPSAPTQVRIEDCGDSTGWLTVDADTGEVTDEPRGRQLVFATVTDVGGQWKVSDFAVRAVGSCG